MSERDTGPVPGPPTPQPPRRRVRLIAMTAAVILLASGIGTGVAFILAGSSGHEPRQESTQGRSDQGETTAKDDDGYITVVEDFLKTYAKDRDTKITIHDISATTVDDEDDPTSASVVAEYTERKEGQSREHRTQYETKRDDTGWTITDLSSLDDTDTTDGPWIDAAERFTTAFYGQDCATLRSLAPNAFNGGTTCEDELPAPDVNTLDTYTGTTKQLDDAADPAKATHATVEVDYVVYNEATEKKTDYTTVFTVELINGVWIITDYQTS